MTEMKLHVLAAFGEPADREGTCGAARPGGPGSAPLRATAGLSDPAHYRSERGWSWERGTDRQAVAARWGSVDNAPGVEPLPAVRDRAVRGLTNTA